MIVAHLSDGTFLVGIEEKNVQMLKAGKPMRIRMSALVPGAKDIVIAYGATLQDVENDLRRHLGELPPANELPPEAVHQE